MTVVMPSNPRRCRPSTAAFGMGNVAAWIALIVLTGAMPAYAQPSNKTQAAYELAMRCFVASGHAELDRHDANDLEGASRYEGKANRAHDMANKLGEQLGYSGERLRNDYQAMMDQELPRLMYEPGYFAKIATECKAYGLM